MQRENQQESVQTADKTHSVWYLFGAAVSAMFAGFAGSKRKKSPMKNFKSIKSDFKTII